MKRIILAVLLALGSAAVAHANAIEPTMYEAPTELTRIAVVADPVPQVGGSHSTTLNWILSTDDTTTACTASANCLQDVYRASGSCTNTFTLLTTTPLSSSVAQYIDSTVTPGVWCYGVTFSINGLESAKDTVSVTLQPASPSGLTGSPK